MAAIFGPDVRSALIVFIAILGGLAMIPVILRINKARTYERWPLLLRWTFVGVKWYLVALGAGAVISLAGERMGLWTIF